MASIICRYNGTSEKICYDSFNMSVNIYVNGTLINYTNTYPVTSDDVVEFVLTTNKIKSDFFYKCTSLVSAVISDDITEIGEDAFGLCASLNSVKIGNGCTTIGNSAFRECGNLVEVTIGSGCEEIGEDAFRYCSKLNSITITAPLSPTITQTTFQYVANNGVLTIPSGSNYSTWLKTGEYYLGYYNWSIDTPPIPLPDISKPDKYSILCLYQGGTNVKICSSVYKFSEIKINGVAIDNTSVNGSSNRNQDLLSTDVVEFIVSDGIIPQAAFWECDALVSVSIGDGITDINTGAFGYCKSLKEITATPKIPPTIHEGAFNGVAKYGTLNYPEGSDYDSWLRTDYGYLGRYLWNNYTEYTNKITYRWGKSGASITLPDNRDSSILDIVVNGESIGNNTHTLDYSDIVEYIVSGIEVPSIGGTWGHATIGEGFEIIKGGFATIESIDFPSTLKIIGDYAFRGCSLTYLTIPKSVAYIGERAFYESTKLLQVKIGDVNKEGGGSDCVIGPYAFAECDIMENYVGGRDVVYSGLQEIIIGDNVIKIDEGAFSFNHNLKHLTIGDGCQYIGDYAFDTCSYIPDIANTSYYIGPEEITIGSGCTYIGIQAFNNWGALNHITITSPIAPKIQDNTFWVVKEYGTLDFPKGSNYSQWLSTSQTYLGYYHWNNVGMGYYYFNLETNTLDITKEAQVIYLEYSSNGSMDMVFVHPSWMSVSQGDGYLIIEVDENDGLYRTAEIEISALAENFEQFTEKLIINQKGTEDMATSIALYSMRLNYPAEGGSLSVQVDYYNPSVINTPYCSQSWVTIEQTQAGTTTQGSNVIEQRQYKITMAPSSFARQTNVKFSCISESGTEVSTDKLMLYQAAPVVNPDDGEGETEVSAFAGKIKVKMDGTPEYSSNTSLNVGYENLTPATPEVDASWIHLGVGTVKEGTSTYDIVMAYPASYDANEGPERVGYITYRGIDANGNLYTDVATVTQLGTDTPVDEGMIELESLSVTLPAEGGSDIFYVKYYDTKTIYDPEFDGDWATIVEINSEESTGTDFNGDVCIIIRKTYKVTAQATDSARQAKVILRADINYYDGGTVHMEKDKFRVLQLADGQTEFKGTVYAFRNHLEFDHKGIPETWGSVKVGYKDVTIKDPVIDSNWFRIKETKDRTYSSKEYDYIYEYTLDVDDTDSLVTREGTITFSGLDEDGNNVKYVVKVTQGGYESDIDTIATNYKGYFKSMDGITYSVSFITDPGYDSYGEITLAGDSPVVVSYSDSSRLYDPIRTSTCTVRVVSTQYLMNLYTGKAQGTQVILRNEDTNTIEWCGFLQPNLYNQGYSDEIEEIEFEASDCLSILQYLKYEDYYSNGRFSIPFSYLIGDILDRTKLITSYYMTQKTFDDGTAGRYMAFNNFFIAEHNFYSEEDEPWTLQEVLEETCKYFGFVCYQWGDKIYFIDYDRFNDEGKMMGYRYDKVTDWSTQNSVVMSEALNNITATSYKGTGADMSMDDVFNKVTVNCNYYNIEDVIPDLFDDELLTNRMEDDGYLKIRRYTGRGNSVLSNETYYRLYDHNNIDSTWYSPIDTYGSNHETKIVPTNEQKKKRDIIEDYVGANIVDMIHLSYNEANGKVGESKDWERYLLISQLNRPWCGAEGTFHWENYNFPIMEFKNLPTIFVDNKETATTGRPGMKTKPKNYLVIDASAAFTPILKNSFLNTEDPKGMEYKKNIDCYIYQDTYTFDHIGIDAVVDKEEITYPALAFYLEIPKKGWWTGAGWVDYKTHFFVPLEGLKWKEDFWNSEKSVENTVESNLFLGSAGYKIPLPSEMDSTEHMYFAIGMPRRFAHLADSSGGDTTGDAGNAYCFIKDLKISICNLYSTLYGDKDEIIENVIDGNNVLDGDEISLKITSDNGQGYSLSNVAVMDTNDVLTTNFKFYAINNEILMPEQAIIQRYVNQYSTPSIKENVTLDMSFKPYQLIKDTWWDKNFVVIGQELDYKMDSQKITLLEKK